MLPIQAHLEVHDLVAAVDSRDGANDASHKDELKGPYTEYGPSGLQDKAYPRPCCLQE